MDNKLLILCTTMKPLTSIFDAPPEFLESLEADDFDAQLLDAVVDHWHARLMESTTRDEVLRWLGVSLATAQRLRIGVSDRTLGLRIPGRRWKAGLMIRRRLDEFAILRDSGHEAFRGCVVIPATKSGVVKSIYGRRLDRSRAELWTSGLRHSAFEAATASSPPTRTLLATSILDALSVHGALEDAGDGASFNVLAPGRAKGFDRSDLKELAARYEHVTVLGRDAAPLVEQLRKLGVLVSVAAEEYDVAKTLTAAPDSRGVVGAWLDGATTLLKVAEVSKVPAGEPASLPAPTTPLVMSTPGRDEAFVTSGSRSWRIRGARIRSNVDGNRLSVALSVSDQASGRFHLDTLDLYAARQRHVFLDAAASELHVDREVLSAEMTDVLGAAERGRDEAAVKEPSVELNAADRQAALAWLNDPALFQRLGQDLSTLGVVGESTNLLVCYLATISRKGDRPLGIIVQSSSAGGKSTLVDAVTSLVPPEDLVSLSAITSQALYYLGGSGLRHKVLSVAEEHGSLRASYALKLLLSEGRLSIASTGKDQGSGRLMTKNYETTGPVALLMTSTATAIDPELENRLVVLGVNETQSQTKAIIEAQRRGVSLEGLGERRRRDELRLLHANVQRLLVAMPVVINHLDHDFPSSATRHRRDHAKLLSIIAAITLLHQFQRESRDTLVEGTTVTYLEATASDIARGLALARVLERTSDGLAPQTARLFEVMRERATAMSRESEVEPEAVEVTRRELRELLGWSVTQVRAATDSLVALEYVVVAGGGRGRCRTYRLVGEVVGVGGGLSPTASTPSSGTTSQLAQLVDVSEERAGELVRAASYAKTEG